MHYEQDRLLPRIKTVTSQRFEVREDLHGSKSIVENLTISFNLITCLQVTSPSGLENAEITFFCVVPVLNTQGEAGSSEFCILSLRPGSPWSCSWARALANLPCDHLMCWLSLQLCPQARRCSGTSEILHLASEADFCLPIIGGTELPNLIVWDTNRTKQKEKKRPYQANYQLQSSQVSPGKLPRFHLNFLAKR